MIDEITELMPKSGRAESAPATKPTQASTDASRIDRFLKGDESAFREIVEDNHPRLFQVVLNMLHNHGDTEEVVQDAFIRAHRGLATFRRESSLRTWLHRIATNLARNRYWYFRRRFRHATISLNSPAEGGGESTREVGDLISSSAPDPSHETSQQECSELMASCLDRLDPDHRTILTQRIMGNRSYGEIGAALGLRPGTVKSRLARGRKRLRLQLAETCPELAFNEWIKPYREETAGFGIQ